MPSPKDAEARLTGLEVREVSVVDRPANKRKFLIVKRDNGGLAVIRTEENMSRAIPKDTAEELGHVLLADQTDTSLVDVLKTEDLADLFNVEDLTETEIGELSEIAEMLEQGNDVVEIQKGVAAEVIKITKAALARLMSIANKIKTAKSDKLPPELVKELKTIAVALTAMVEKVKSDKTKEEKSDNKDSVVQKDIGAEITSIVEKLMAIVNQLKELEADAAIPPAILATIQAIATGLNSLASKYGESEQGETEQAEGSKGKDAKQTEKREEFELFLKNGSDTSDPEVIVKVGSKMRKTRLSMFKKAIEMLSELLKELSPADGEKAKNFEANKDFQAAMMQKLDGISSEVSKVAKRVDELESGTRPVGNDDDPPQPIVKQKSMWGNILGTTK